jgi:hypothetical protein
MNTKKHKPLNDALAEQFYLAIVQNYPLAKVLAFLSPIGCDGVGGGSLKVVFEGWPGF